MLKVSTLCKIGDFFGTFDNKILKLTCMFKYPPNLTHSSHTFCTKKLKKKLFSLCSRGVAKFWGPKKPLLIVGMDWRTSNSYSWWVNYMSTKSHIHEMYGTLRKTSFCTKGYAEIHIQRPFFDIENDIWKILRLKIQTVYSCFGAPSTHESYFFWRNQNLKFWWNFKVSWNNCL